MPTKEELEAMTIKYYGRVSRVEDAGFILSDGTFVGDANTIHRWEADAIYRYFGGSSSPAWNLNHLMRETGMMRVNTHHRNPLFDQLVLEPAPQGATPQQIKSLTPFLDQPRGGKELRIYYERRNMRGQIVNQGHIDDATGISESKLRAILNH